MREHSRDKERLEHIRECIERIFRYSENCTLDQLMADDMRYFAIVKNIEIIGEAANMLSAGFIDEHPETPWKMIVKMRHYIVHEYFNIDNDVVWEVLNNDLPELSQQIDKYLSETDWAVWENSDFD